MVWRDELGFLRIKGVPLGAPIDCNIARSILVPPCLRKTTFRTTLNISPRNSDMDSELGTVLGTVLNFGLQSRTPITQTFLAFRKSWILVAYAKIVK